VIPASALWRDPDYGEILAALRAGMRGYIPTSLASAVVFEAVRLICAGDTYAPSACLLRHADQQQQTAAAASPSEPPSVSFSPRQRQILDCLRRGMANKQIALALSMSEGTVKVHVCKIMRKLNATNRTQVAMMTLSLSPEIGALPGLPT
jgi:DNA-binding NarL/FixJ family response regulator